jgi:hypothetical protein
MSIENYYNEIRSDIAKEFGFEAVGLGANRLTNNEIKEAVLAYRNATPEQLALVEKIRKERYGF